MPSITLQNSAQGALVILRRTSALEAKQDALVIAIREQGERTEKAFARIDARLDEIEARLSGVRDEVRSARAWITAAIAIVAIIAVGPRITWL